MIRVTLLLVLVCMVSRVRGHGRLRSPAGRSSLWRDGFITPENYQDNELNCGGRYVHHEVNHGKCGVCGDPYHAPIQENQPPYGRYANPVLADCYSTNDQYIDIFVEITANHVGYMEFRLCPNNNFYSPVTEECLDDNVLNVIDENGKNHGTRFHVRPEHRDLFLKVEIPKGMTCTQCVLQWRYVAGNNWGCDYYKGRRRSCGIGRGGQESFFNCADIAILDNCRGKVTRTGVIDREAENRAKAAAGRPLYHFDDEDLNPSGIIGREIANRNKKHQNNPTTKPEKDAGREIEKKEESQNILTTEPEEDVGREIEKDEESQNNPTTKPEEDVGREIEKKEESQNILTTEPEEDVGRDIEKDEESQNNPTTKPEKDVGREIEKKKESLSNASQKPQEDVGRGTRKNGKESQNNLTEEPHKNVADSSTKASGMDSTGGVVTKSEEDTQDKQTSSSSQSQNSNQNDNNSDSDEGSAEESVTTGSITKKPQPPPQADAGPKRCGPVGVWIRVKTMAFWCTRNCAVNFCPPSMCKCY